MGVGREGFQSVGQEKGRFRWSLAVGVSDGKWVVDDYNMTGAWGQKREGKRTNEAKIVLAGKSIGLS